jgi:hypothetical protein
VTFGFVTGEASQAFLHKNHWMFLIGNYLNGEVASEAEATQHATNAGVSAR